MQAIELTNFNKAGVVTTDSVTAISDVVFKKALPYGFQYVVALTVVDQASPVAAFASNMTANGFRITSWNPNGGGGAGVAQPSTKVHWMVRAVFND
jgi:hypothetical protein